VTVSFARTLMLLPLTLALLPSCKHSPEVSPAAVPRSASATPLLRRVRATTPELSYWEEATVVVTAATVPPLLPPFQVSALDSEVQASAPEAVSLLASQGFVYGQVTGVPMFEQYFQWTVEGKPVLLTSDAVMQLVRIALNRAFAEAEAVSLRPLLQGVLSRVGPRLLAESASAPVDLRAGSAIARRTVFVAQALLATEFPGIDPLDADVVKEELLRIETAKGRLSSSVLGSAVDYGAFASIPRGIERAVAWLSLAPFALLAKTEVASKPGTGSGTAREDVGTCRDQTRAAMLIARALDPDTDGRAAIAAQRIERFVRFAFGRSEDPSLLDLAVTADALRFNITEPIYLTDITRVDRLRRAVATRQLSGDAWSAGQTPKVPAPSARQSSTLFLLPRALTDDSRALRSLLGTSQTTPPSVLDVVRVLGEAQPEPTQQADYDARVATLWRERQAEPGSARHASVYGAMLDGVTSLAGPSVADSASVFPISQAWEGRRRDSFASTWAMLRSEAHAFGRTAPALVPVEVPRLPSVEDPPRVYVEPKPEALLKLLLAVEQLARGLSAQGLLARPGTAEGILREVDEALRTMLALALAQAEDRPLTDAQPLLTRLVWLERTLMSTDVFAPRRPTPVWSDGKHRWAVGTAPARVFMSVVRVPSSSTLEIARGVTLPFADEMQ
jgi:hypothetical protein